MDLKSIPLMKAITQRMTWLSRNQSVVSQNIANADTPGYMAQRLKKQNFQRLLEQAPQRGKGAVTARVAMVQTAAGHMDIDGSQGPRIRQDDADAFEITPDDNAVVLEEELMAMAKTRQEYGLMVNTYRKNVQILRTVMGRRE